MDYRNLTLLLALIVSGSLFLADKFMHKRGLYSLSIIEAIQLINKKNAVIIDLRSMEDFEIGHLPYSYQINIGEIIKRIANIVKCKNTPILIVCQNGQQSRKAVSIVKEAGFIEVNMLDGGIDAWKKFGLPVVK